MIKIKNKSDCCGCGACVNACPKKCIKMTEDNEGFNYPKADEKNCVNCGLCQNACPVLKRDKDKKLIPECYAAYNKDYNVRLDSSSGGVFSLIAEWFLKNNGVVYGATFDKENCVQHSRIDDSKYLYRLRKSKYVQSDIGDCYKLVKNDLKKLRLVYFTGTPCQVEGLLKYLNKDYDNLYTQDIICHGVPSKKVWQKYLSEKKIDEYNDINFRDKSNGWYDYEVKLTGNNNAISMNHGEDLYMKSFLSECNIRPSCYDCKFKKTHRVSDLTLGDFWGVDKTCPEMYDEKGVSAILVHTQKGKSLLEIIKTQVVIKKVLYSDIVSNNNSYYESAKKNKCRKKFFKNIDNYEMKVLCGKYCESSFKQRLIIKVKKILKKFCFIKLK